MSLIYIRMWDEIHFSKPKSVAWLVRKYTWYRLILCGMIKSAATVTTIVITSIHIAVELQ